MDIKITPHLLQGSVHVPASKSIAHRLLICAALSNGVSHLSNVTDSEDITATCLALSALGAKIERNGTDVTVTGIQALPNAPVTLPCRESGSTLRFLVPIAAALGLNARFTGQGRLPYRPLDAYLRELSQKGIVFSPVHEDGALLPLTLCGQLCPGTFSIEGNVSSQYLTGLLFALPLLEGDSELRLLSPLESAPYVELTIAALAAFGITIQPTASGYYIPGGQRYVPCDRRVEPDYSQAAFFLTANAIGNRIALPGLSEKSLQGDQKIVEIISKLCYNKKSTPENAFVIYAQDIPDLVPILSVLGSLGSVPMRIRGAGRLRFKESDRLQTTAAALCAIGGRVTQTEDGLDIEPISQFTGGTASGFGDHRIVMSLAIAATRAEHPVIIRGAEAVNKSYPTFFTDYQNLGGTVNGITLE